MYKSQLKLHNQFVRAAHPVICHYLWRQFTPADVSSMVNISCTIWDWSHWSKLRLICSSGCKRQVLLQDGHHLAVGHLVVLVVQRGRVQVRPPSSGSGEQFFWIKIVWVWGRETLATTSGRLAEQLMEAAESLGMHGKKWLWPHLVVLNSR